VQESYVNSCKRMVIKTKVLSKYALQESVFRKLNSLLKIKPMLMGQRENFSEIRIREQLNRILSTPAFKNSSILSGFLKFVINETLTGKEQEIKEYTIGVHVLSRNIDFNPQLDAIVRIHAGRLRRALKEYYYEMGKKDPILIEIPKGSYIPLFQSQDGMGKGEIAEKINLVKSRPVVAVLPFRNISKDSSRDFFADGLGEQLSTDLTQFHDLSVISYYSSRHAAGKTIDVKEAANLLGAKYIITGSIQNDNKHLKVWVQLIFGDSGEQLWAKSFERNNSASGLFEIQNEIVRSILKAIGGYNGVIFRDLMQAPRSNRANSIEICDAIFWYYHYQKVTSVEVFQKTISALEAAVKADPDYALAWAMLGEVYLDGKAYEFKQNVNPAAEGLKCALHAVSIDPNCQHAYQALAWAYLFHHKRGESLKAADQCIALNPNAADRVGAMGFVLICAGEFERGYVLMNDSILHNPYCPWWFYAGFVFYFLHKKDYLKAFHCAEKVDVPELFWDPLLKAAALGQLNRTDEAGKNLKLLTQLVPNAASQVKEIIESFLLSQDLHNEILEGLRKAGLNEERQTSFNPPR
jgi:TolB-like protein